MAKQYRVTAGKRAVTWLMAQAARLGLGNFVVLTTTGRKSDLPRQVTVSPIEDGGVEYLVSPYGDRGWVLNARANPVVTIRKGQSDEVVRLNEVTGTKAELVRRYYKREAFSRGFMDVPGDATVDDFASVAQRFPVFEIVRET